MYICNLFDNNSVSAQIDLYLHTCIHTETFNEKYDYDYHQADYIVVKSFCWIFNRQTSRYLSGRS